MFKQQSDKIEALEQEKLAIQRDLARVSEMLQARTIELENIQAQGANQ